MIIAYEGYYTKQALGKNTPLESTVVRNRYLTRYARTHKVDSWCNLAYACFVNLLSYISISVELKRFNK